jgi:hypothetical protein
MNEEKFYSSLYQVQLSLSRVETDLKHIQENLSEFKESGKSLTAISSRLQAVEAEHTLIKRGLIFVLALIATYSVNRVIVLLFPSHPNLPTPSLTTK